MDLDKRRKDMLGKIPLVGDLICYNPPRVKGILIMVCKDFAKSGLPQLVSRSQWKDYQDGKIDRERFIRMGLGNTPRTGFVIINE